jgi:ABC-2 type transport system ATP-binding protein
VSPQPLLQVRGVTKAYYGQKVLSDISFDIAEGEVFGYIGPNGAGKTTTLKILAGLIRKFDGAVTIGGADVVKDRAKAHALIGFMPQSCGFQSWRTVDSALDSLAALSGVGEAERKQRIPRWLERFDLLAARGKKVKQLSGGMTQKLGLIQALLHEPKLLVLDEPLEGLDPPSRQMLKDVIRERREAGTTVLFSSHILSDVEHVANRVGILNAGEVATTGSMRELMSTFGWPVVIDVWFAEPPREVGFLSEVGTAAERRSGQWQVTLGERISTAVTDAAIHTIVERTLAGGGRLRKIGVAEPALDELFARYVLERRPGAPVA